MNKLFAAMLLSTLCAAPFTAPAQAKGCIKGAIVGGLGGHVVGHGVAGAVAGCAVGHHLASRHEAERRTQVDQDRHMEYNSYQNHNGGYDSPTRPY